MRLTCIHTIFLAFGILMGYIITLIDWQFEYPGWTATHNITGSLITFKRNNDMIITAYGKNSAEDALKALGWAHIHDRYVQICLYRLISQGKLSETLPPNEKSFQLDFRSKQLNLWENAIQSYNSISNENMKQIGAYIDGINFYIKSHPRPIEFILINYYPTSFTVIDILIIQKFIAFAGLNDINLLVEKVLLEVIRETDQHSLLKDTFYPHLNDLNEDLVEIYKSLKDFRPLADHSTSDIPKITNSNNWVISGKLSKSGFPIMGSDPHMDIAKMPNIFYESQYIADDGLRFFGVSPVGVPVMLFGKTQNISFSLTFGMLDMADYFIENIKDKQYERDGKFYPLEERTVNIQDKTIFFYETSEGHQIERRLESYEDPISTGKYLAARYPMTAEVDSANSKLFGVAMETNIFKCMEVVSFNGLGTNFIFADNQGNIAYQQVTII